MKGDAPVSWLMFFTFAAAIFIIAGFFIRHLHSQRNREIAANALVGDGTPPTGVAPHGALGDLAGVLVFALIIMGLLGLGYHHKSAAETNQPMPPLASESTAQPPSPASEPKPNASTFTTNPAAPSTSTPSTSAPSTGAASGNGGQPQGQPKQ